MNERDAFAAPLRQRVLGAEAPIPRVRTTALGLLIITLCACGPTLQEVREPVAAPERFSELPAAADRQPLPDQWWTSFADPELNNLVMRAVNGNFTLRNAWDRLAQAEATARKAGVDSYPFLDAEGSATHSRSRMELHGDREWDGTNNFSLGLAAGYEVDLWGRVRATRNAADLDVRASAEDLRAAAITLSAQVATIWYTLVEQYGQLELLDEQIATNEKVLELITLRFRRGQAGAADVLQQRQLAESNRGEKALVQGRAAVLEHELAILLGLPPEDHPLPRKTGRRAELPELPPLPATGLPADLIRRRPDVRSAYYGLAAADQRVAAALADRYPRVSLSARVNTSGNEVGDLFRNWFATLAADLLGPVFDAGLRQAEVDRTRAMAAQQLHRYGQIVLDALGDVEDALAQERQQRARIASLDQQLGLSALVMERIRDRYLNGAEGYLRVLDVLLTHQQLQRTRLAAERELIEQRIALCRALGGGWDMQRPQLAVGTSPGGAGEERL